MYQFYESEDLQAIVQVYSEDEVTPEYAKNEIDNLTDGNSELFEPVSLSLDMFDYMRAKLPFSVSDDIMRVWKFSNQTFNTSILYERSEVKPYDAVKTLNTSKVVDLVRI